MSKIILIRPIISEKAETGASKNNRYSFEVAKDVNKIEIGTAVAKFYGVTVAKVNTCVMPSKSKNRNTKRGFVKGSVPSYKKAMVTLAEGDTIDFYGAEEESAD
jgi:large subunit ribosomal protein L23